VSGKAIGQAFDHSPYKGTAFVVLLAVADVVNDVHEHEFWMTSARLAEKAHTTPGNVRHCLARMVADGWLEVVDSGGGRSRPTRYRWTFTEPVDNPGISAGTGKETASPDAVTGAETASGTTQTASGAHRQRTQQLNPSTNSRLQVAVDLDKSPSQMCRSGASWSDPESIL